MDYSIFKQLLDFEEQLIKIRIVTNISSEECEKLSQGFLKLTHTLSGATRLAEEYWREKAKGDSSNFVSLTEVDDSLIGAKDKVILKQKEQFRKFIEKIKK